jgi:seryl-tRNA synthetase
MLDPKYIRKYPKKVKDNLKKRGLDPALVDQFIDIDNQYRKLLNQVAKLKQNKNELTKLIGAK